MGGPTFLLLGSLLAQGSPATNRDTNNLTRLPAVTVTAQKEVEPVSEAPVSVTPVPLQTLQEADIDHVRDAAIYAPNVNMTDFSARKLSNPRFRGIGSSPNNPGITTYIDGVPQLNANSSSIELIDVGQVEFVRGPQGALFGRNTVGGLINISSRPPSNQLTAEIEGSYGNYDYRDIRARASSPLGNDQWSFSLAGGYTARDGYTENTVTGNDLDSREAWFGKAQIAFTPNDQFEARLILSGETADDGDYALGDLNLLRNDPHDVARDYEGYTERDIFAPTLLGNWHNDAVQLESITGAVFWETFDTTDLDYTPNPLATRDNEEEQTQFTQELRLSSAEDAPIQFSDDVALSWQSGIFFFTQNYEQVAANDLSPIITGAPVPVRNTSTAELDDLGIGIYGQGKLTLWDRLDLIAGLRFDWEDKEASLGSSTDPALAPATEADLDNDYSEVSPQFGVAYHFTPEQMSYATVTRGYKAGGFNAVSPGGSEIYDEEHSWNYELGHKSEWLDGRLRTGIALFYMDWDELQLNVPFIAVPGQFFIDNAGSAISKGVELEAAYRVLPGWDLFGSFGYTDAEFRSGSAANGAGVSGNEIPFTPEYTANAGTQFSWLICPQATVYARAEVTFYGDFAYDEQNLAGQDAYELANFRLGLRGTNWFAESWVRNAFEEDYIPVAFAYSPAFAPSGFVGESGAPVTFGVRAGLSF